MVMERLTAILGHPGNQKPETQETIKKAMDLLKEGGVIDSGPAATSTGLRPIEAAIVLPEGAIRLPDVATTGMSNREMRRLALATRGLKLHFWGKDIIERAHTTSKELGIRRLVAMDALTMGIRDVYPKTVKIWKKAKRFGDSVSAEEMLRIAVKAARGEIQIEIGKSLVGIMELADSSSTPGALSVTRSRDGLWLDARFAYPHLRWDNPDVWFVVSPRK